MISYTLEERAAADGADEFFRRTGLRPLCPSCQRDGHGFGLGEHLAVDGESHVVTWQCNRGHVLSCAELLEQLVDA